MSESEELIQLRERVATLEAIVVAGNELIAAYQQAFVVAEKITNKKLGLENKS